MKIIHVASSKHFSRYSRLLVTIYISSLHTSCPMLRPSMLLVRKLSPVRSLWMTWSMAGHLSINSHRTSKILGCPWRKLEIMSCNSSKGSTSKENVTIMEARDCQPNLYNPERQSLLHSPPRNVHNPETILHILREHLHLMDSQLNRPSTSESIVRNFLKNNLHRRMIQKTFQTILHGPFFEPNSTRSNPAQTFESPPFLSLRL